MDGWSLLEVNRALQNELRREADVNRRNERKIKSIEKQLSQYESELSRKEVDNEELYKEIQDLKNEISKLKRLLYQAQKENKEKSAYIAQCEDIIKELEARVIKLKNRIYEITTNKNNLRTQNMANVGVRNQTFSQLARSLKDIISNFQNHFNHQTTISQDNAHNQLVEAKDITDEIQNRYDEKGVDLEYVQNKYKQLVVEFNASQKHNNELQSQVDKLMQENHDLQDEYFNLEGYTEQLEGESTSYYFDSQRWENESKKWENETETWKNETEIWKRKVKKWKNKTNKWKRRKEKWTGRAIDARRRWSNEKAISEYWREELERRYRKWKEKTKQEKEANQELNDRIAILENNLPQPPVVNMANIPPPTYSGTTDEDVDTFINLFRGYLAAINVNPVGAQRYQALGILRGCMKGDGASWYDDNILGKRWKLNNILNNHGQANKGALQGQTMQQMIASNSFRVNSTAFNYANNPANANVTVGASMIPNEAFDEDWTLAGGCSTSENVNNIGANNANPIIFRAIEFGQAVFLIKTQSPIVLEEKRKLQFGTLRQGNDSVRTFYTNLKKTGKMLYYGDEIITDQFFRGLSPENQDEAERIGMENH